MSHGHLAHAPRKPRKNTHSDANSATHRSSISFAQHAREPPEILRQYILKSPDLPAAAGASTTGRAKEINLKIDAPAKSQDRRQKLAIPVYYPDRTGLLTDNDFSDNRSRLQQKWLFRGSHQYFKREERKFVMHKTVRRWALHASLIVSVSLAAPLSAAVEVTTAFQIPHQIRHPMQPEGNATINELKAKMTVSGAMVYIYLRNTGDSPVDIKDVRWDDKGLQERTDSYELIWQRLQPNPLQPRELGELALCLRTQLHQPTNMSLVFTDGSAVDCTIKPTMPDCRIETITFDHELRRAYLYIQQQRPGAPTPAAIVVEGANGASSFRWLSDDLLAGLRIAVVEFPEPLERGALHTFLVSSSSNDVVTAATIRAHADLVVFGTYGSRDLTRYAINGLTGYNSFTSEPKDILDLAHRLGMRVVSMVHGHLRPEGYSHPGLYAYNHLDEPDVRDWGLRNDRPGGLAVGGHAPEMLQYDRDSRADASIPTILTLDLTYTPYNYFIYAPIADITNPDCYPLTVGWSIRVVRDYLATVKQACMPKPFTYTYQGCWEEATQQMAWVGGEQVRAQGWDAFRDKTKTRGLGRPPLPSEVRIPIFYALASGARGVFSFVDASCANQGLLIHGSEDLPDVWAEIGRTSRTFNQVAQLIDIAHPTDWALSDAPKLWIRTLVCGEQAALIIVVNEDYDCTAEGFTLRPIQNAALTFNDWPWLKGQHVFRLDDENMEQLPTQRDANSLLWHDKIKDAQVYLVVSDAAVAQKLHKNAQTKADRQARAIIAELRNRQ